MSNQAKEIDAGIEALGNKLTFPRTGFRKPQAAAEKPFIKRVGDDTATAAPEVTSKPTPAKKPEKLFDRITFEISAEQRAALTNIATTLNFRIPREKRKEKINRDMLMRAILSVAEKIKWDEKQDLHSEADIKRFVLDQFLAAKKATDKNEADWYKLKWFKVSNFDHLGVLGEERMRERKEVVVKNEVFEESSEN